MTEPVAPAVDRMLCLRVVVYGIPGPQGSKTPKGRNPKTGRIVMVESSKKVKPWRALVDAAARDAIHRMPREQRMAFPLDGPLVGRMVFTMAKPTSAPKGRQIWPTTYPDASKLLRSTEDALKTAGALADDARLVDFDRLAKVFPGEDPEALDRPGVRLSVRRLVPAATGRWCHAVREDVPDLPCVLRPHDDAAHRDVLGGLWHAGTLFDLAGLVGPEVSAAAHEFVPGGDDATFGGRGTWCAVWLGVGDEADQCGRPREAHQAAGRG
ncbi:RusA family crossover junction endodeoxyribonuclease [Micromonospora sp. DT227]|uniref:RusA family crossover junction endodeoxyribonuclease n=1 Tax=Micromonospora sp. DT227 TaxID=3393433 RepID=UPI003CF312DF